MDTLISPHIELPLDPLPPLRPTLGLVRSVPRSQAPVSALRLRKLSVHLDPTDARRAMIAGSMAEVCAALDRLVRWQESDLVRIE